MYLLVGLAHGWLAWFLTGAVWKNLMIGIICHDIICHIVYDNVIAEAGDGYIISLHWREVVVAVLCRGRNRR